MRGSGNQSAGVMMTGRWSERTVVSCCLVTSTVRYVETVVRSENELGSLFRTLLGESSLRKARLLALRRSIIVWPHEVAWSSPFRENQKLWLALKSPKMIVSSSWELSRVFWLGLYPVGYHEIGRDVDVGDV